MAEQSYSKHFQFTKHKYSQLGIRFFIFRFCEKKIYVYKYLLHRFEADRRTNTDTQ